MHFAHSVSLDIFWHVTGYWGMGSECVECERENLLLLLVVSIWSLQSL